MEPLPYYSGIIPVAINAQGQIGIVVQQRDEHAPVNPLLIGLFGGTCNDTNYHVHNELPDFNNPFLTAKREAVEELGAAVLFTNNVEYLTWLRKEDGKHSDGTKLYRECHIFFTTLAADLDKLELNEGKNIVFVPLESIPAFVEEHKIAKKITPIAAKALISFCQYLQANGNIAKEELELPINIGNYAHK